MSEEETCVFCYLLTANMGMVGKAEHASHAQTPFLLKGACNFVAHHLRRWGSSTVRHIHKPLVRAIQPHQHLISAIKMLHSSDTGG